MESVGMSYWVLAEVGGAVPPCYLATIAPSLRDFITLCWTGNAHPACCILWNLAVYLGCSTWPANHVPSFPTTTTLTILYWHSLCAWVMTQSNAINLLFICIIYLGQAGWASLDLLILDHLILSVRVLPLSIQITSTFLSIVTCVILKLCMP